MQSTPSPESNRKGLLLLNLGSPLSPSPKDVKQYLDEFLNDPYVIDLPYLFRKILVNGIILNTRPKASAEAYQKIWAKDGSPLLINTRALTEKVKLSFSKEDVPSIKMAMRYGKPDVASVLEDFKKEGIKELTFIPLYPQYSYAASESSLAYFSKLAAEILPSVRVQMIEDFFSAPEFIHALADSMRGIIEDRKPDLVLLSYHGIPERQIAKIKQPPTDCCRPGCCDLWTRANEKCYRAQCFETSRLLAKELGLAPDQVVTSFQSRLGRTKWIEPYTDILLTQFPAQGKKRIVVASPSFTSDCLETLEEIQLRYRDLFLESGGEYFEYMPCLNADPAFAHFLAKLASGQSTPHPL